jgi:hypothetical protein
MATDCLARRRALIRGENDMNLSRHIYTSRREKIGHAVLGLILFLVLNVASVALLIGLSLSSGVLSDTLNTANGTAAYGLTTLLLNVGLLIYFGFTRYWVALGALVVCTIWFVVVLLLAPQCFGLNPTVVDNGNGLRSMSS